MDCIANCPSCGSDSIWRIFPTSFTPILNYREKSSQSGKRAPNAILNNIRMENCGTGVKAEGGYIKGKNVKMKDCGTGIDSINSNIDIKDLDIS